MKVTNIPAYSYFAGSSYRSDINIVSDNKVLKWINENYPTSSGIYTNVWTSSGSTYSQIWRTANRVLGAPIFYPTHRVYQIYNNNTVQPPAGWYARFGSDFGIVFDDIKITDAYNMPASVRRYANPDSMVALNGDTVGQGISGTSGFYFGLIESLNRFSQGAGDFFTTCYLSASSLNSIEWTVEVALFPEEIFENGVLISREKFENDENIPVPCFVRMVAAYSTEGAVLTNLTGFSVGVQKFNKRSAYNSLLAMLSTFHLQGSGTQEMEYDDDNPYGEDGSSTTGGGDGTLLPGGLDYIDPTEIPEVPTLSAANCGFMTIYNPSVSQLQALADFMWSGAFDLDSYKKLFSDPMESIIGLAIVPVAPDIGGTKNVMFGTIDSGVNMSYVSSQYKKVNCGSVDIQKYVGCFMDYSPYTKISIYLPYIGIRDLSPDDITGGSINVTYIVDVLSGACACFISHSVKGVLYSFNGSCISNIPLTAQNFSGAIQNAVSAVIGGVGVIAGMATGAAPVTAMGAMGLLNSAANTAMNSKPHIQRSGNLGGSAGIMSVQKPFIIIERPNLSVPSNVQHYVGQTSNLTRNLGDCSGFTMVEYIHLHDISATSEELSEIETLLKQGVIL